VYRGGTPALSDLLAGQFAAQFATVAQALPQLQSRTVARDRHLVGDALRLGAGYPTFREQGIDLVTTNGTACSRPAARRVRSIDKLNAEMKRIMALPTWATG